MRGTDGGEGTEYASCSLQGRVELGLHGKKRPGTTNLDELELQMDGVRRRDGDAGAAARREARRGGRVPLGEAREQYRGRPESR